MKLIVVTLLFSVLTLSSQTPVMVNREHPSDDSNPNSLVNVNGMLYFFADDGLHGQELWKSDGTDSGTQLVKDIYPGQNGSSPNLMFNLRGTLYFMASDSNHGQELWKSDGTAKGTVIVKDINKTGSSSYRNFTDVNGVLYCIANNGINGLELWKSDGTDSGTVMVKDIWQGTNGSAPEFLTVVNNLLYFRSNDGVNGAELWRSDGTDTGTFMVRDLYGSGSSNPIYLCEMNGNLFFRAYDGNVTSMWKCDGTDVGTVVLKNVIPTGKSVEVNGNLFFSAFISTSGSELWRTDGTPSGTVMVKDIRAGSTGSNPDLLTAVGDTLYFIVNDGSGTSLWKSDGTSKGTVLVSNVNSAKVVGLLTDVNGKLYFKADLGYGPKLWKSDGSTLGTMMVDFEGADNSSGPAELLNVNGVLFFRISDGVKGEELWKSDGIYTGTKMVKDIKRYGDLDPFYLTNVNGMLYFNGCTGPSPNWIDNSELWKSDGTDKGTVRVGDLNKGSSSSYPTSITAADSLLYFVANSSTLGLELWKSDGTEKGTKVVKDINPGSNGTYLDNLTYVDGVLYFTAGDPSNGTELWRSDGTDSGTHMVMDIRSGSNGSLPELFTYINGTLFFKADDGINGLELWKSDGTAAGTGMVKSIRPGSNGSAIEALTNVNGKLFFIANDGTNGRQLWKSDGTANGTVMIKKINPGGDCHIDYLTPVNNTLFFRADDGANGLELWKSDGTSQGTLMVKNICSKGDSWPYQLTDINGKVYFSAYDDVNGNELWISDGTSSGTRLVKDINSGIYSSNFNVIIEFDGVAYFCVSHTTYGQELWKSDGTDSGTVMVKDIRPGSGGSNPVFFTIVNGALFFQSNDGIHGKELWMLCVSPVINSQPADMEICEGGTALFSLKVKGGGLTYQWKKDGVAIQGADAATFTINNAGFMDTGTYSCDVTNGCGKVSSESAILAIHARTGIVSQSEALSLCPGSDAVFKVKANGEQLNYQWQKNGMNINGAKADSLFFNSVMHGDEGDYICLIKGFCGNESSDSIPLTVYVSTEILRHPDSLNVCSGEPAAFFIVSKGDKISRQWKRNGVDISGANSDTLLLAQALQGDAAEYNCSVSGTCGNAISDTALLDVTTINASLSVNNTTIKANQNAASYQWIECSNRQSIKGATGQSFTAVSNGDYAVIIRLNSCTDTSECTNINTIDINNIIAAGQFKFYPNPNTGKFTVMVMEQSVVEITDASGRMIYFGNLGQGTSEIDLDNIESGFYMVKVVSDKGQNIQRMVVCKPE